LAAHGKSDAPHGKEIVVKFKELVDDAVAYAKDVLANYKDIPFIALGSVVWHFVSLGPHYFPALTNWRSDIRWEAVSQFT
jgi:hypothetical protein